MVRFHFPVISLRILTGMPNVESGGTDLSIIGHIRNRRKYYNSLLDSRVAGVFSFSRVFEVGLFHFRVVVVVVIGLVNKGVLYLYLYLVSCKNKMIFEGSGITF